MNVAVDSLSSPADVIKENQIISKVGRILIKHFRGWAWDINCTLHTGVVAVKCLNLHGEYGVILHIEQIEQAGGESVAVLAIGEFLERCGMPAGAAPAEIIAERDSRGNIKNIDTAGADTGGAD